MSETDQPETPQPAAPGRGAARERVLQKLEDHFEQVVEDLDAHQAGYKGEARALKITKLLAFMDERRDDVAVSLEAMTRFVRFCLRELSEEEMQPVRKAVRMFVEELRRNHE